jgi:hypothetical protein
MATREAGMSWPRRPSLGKNMVMRRVMAMSPSMAHVVASPKPK